MYHLEGLWPPHPTVWEPLL